MKCACLALCLLLAAGLAQAQTLFKPHFAVQLGVFKAPDVQKFQAFADLGTILADSTSGGLVRLRLGDYASRTKADSVLKVMHVRGHKGGFVIESPAVEGRGVLSAAAGTSSGMFSVQLGAFARQKIVPSIEQVRQLGNVYVLEQGNMRKLRAGAFTSRDSAQALLEQIKQLGFSDAYISEVSPEAMSRELATRQTLGRNFQTAFLYKRMSGTLNNQPVVVHIYFSGNSMAGFYNDPETQDRRKFVHYGDRPDSRLSADALLSASAAKQPEAVVEDLRPRYTLKFTIKEPASKRDLRFALQESYDSGSVPMQVQSRYRKKVDSKNGLEIGTDVYMEYPQISLAANQWMANKLNGIFVQLPANESTINSHLDLKLARNLREVAAQSPQVRWLSETFETKILENDHGILSVRLVQERIGDKVQSSVIHRSFDMSNGNELKLPDLMNYDYVKQLRAMLRKKMGQRYAALRPPLPDLNSSVEEMMNNYYLTSTGVVFYREYRAWSVVQEPIELTISYQDLKPMIREGRFLAKF